ncbi:hypothetical protein [Micromonospora sp. NPDC049679]|uniref:hypothetical protein n=1 Tax=Micromonospora sp. NPDC049679 TaxID=3155920 RepID=UPI0033E98CAA
MKIHTLTRTVVSAGVVLVSVAAAALSGAAPAAAATRYGCEWPRVCFYKTEADWQARRPTATYQDMGYWQTLGSHSAYSEVVYNSRNDDGALLRMQSGITYCVKGGQTTPEFFMPVYQDGAMEELKIMDSKTC